MSACPTIRTRVLAALLPLLLCAACAGQPSRPSVLLITLDTTRVDRLGCYGHDGADTPRLDAVAARGVAFDSAYTSAPITLPAHASIFTGTYPQYHGVRDNGSFRLDERLVTLAEVFRAAGHRTAAFVGAYPVDSRFGLDQGFEIYDDALGEPGDHARFAYDERPAVDVVEAATGWLDDLERGQRFLAWVHVFDPHAPYAPPEPFASDHAADPYQGEIAYVDHALGLLFDRLETLGRTDETLVVVVADHGEGLGDHGEDSHAALIYDTTVRVPLLIAGPGVPAGERVGATVRTIDVLPTLTELAGLDAPHESQGVSLVPLWRDDASSEPRSAYVETQWPRLQYDWSELRGIVHDGWKLIEAPDAPPPATELYALATDPDETEDRGATDTAMVERLQRELARVFERTTSNGAFDADRELTPEDAERLAALGYLGTPGVERHAGAHPRGQLGVMQGIVTVRNLIDAGRPRDALALLDRLESEDPGGLGLLEHRGLAWRELAGSDPQALARAEAAFRKAVAVNPRRAELWVHLGEVLRQQGRYPDALACYERSLDLAPPSPDLVINHAGVLAVLGRRDEAIERVEAMLAERPGLANVWLTLAVLQAGAGRNEAALTSFGRVAELAGDDTALAARAHDLAGLLLEQLGRNEEAARRYEQALALAPWMSETRKRLERLRQAG